MKEVYQNEEDGNVVGDTLEDMVREGARRMLAALLAGGDGALDRVYPTTARQRCLSHRALNVQTRLPKALHSEARRRLREMSYAPSRTECERLRDEYVSELKAGGRSDAAETVLRDWESFVSFYDFPTASADDEPF